MNAFDTHLTQLLESIGWGWTAEAVFRIVLAACAGGLVGAEREIRGREAGFRTHILVCMASALVMVLSIQMTQSDWSGTRGQGVTVNVDLTRIGYAVMTGIGFLGAGTILQTRGSVRGLTTAAAMWSVAAVGLAAGFGLYTLTIVSATMIVLTLWIFNYLGDAFPRRRYRTVKLRGKWTANCIPDAVDLFDGTDVEVVETTFERLGPDLGTVDIELRVAFSKKYKYYAVERRLHSAGDFQLLAAHTT